MKTNYSPRILTATALLAGVLTVLSGEVRDEYHQTFNLDKAGEVSLENVTGSVRIRAWDRDEVKLDAVKRAKSQEQVDEVDIDVQATPDKIQIKTKYPARENNRNSTSVDYTLTVPRNSKLKRINLVNGPIEIEGVRGEVEVNSVNGPVTASGVLGRTVLSTVNGPVKATLKELNQPVSLKSVNGTVTVAVDAGANANVLADTLHGAIKCDFPLTVQKSFPLGQKLEGKLGNGGPKVQLSTVNGGVYIDQAESTL